MIALGKASQSFACSASMRNYIHYAMTLLKLLHTLTITLLYATLSIKLLCMPSTMFTTKLLYNVRNTFAESSRLFIINLYVLIFGMVIKYASP